MRTSLTPSSLTLSRSLSLSLSLLPVLDWQCPSSSLSPSFPPLFVLSHWSASSAGSISHTALLYSLISQVFSLPYLRVPSQPAFHYTSTMDLKSNRNPFTYCRFFRIKGQFVIAMHIGDCYRDFPLRPACCRNPLVSRSRHTRSLSHFSPCLSLSLICFGLTVSLSLSLSLSISHLEVSVHQASGFVSSGAHPWCLLDNRCPQSSLGKSYRVGIVCRFIDCLYTADLDMNYGEPSKLE